MSEDYLMIITHYPISINEKGERGYYDYSACIYPFGVDMNDDPYLFNHEDIRQVFFIGYVNPLEEKLIEQYTKNLSKIPYRKLSINE
ncbi:DUF4176 domain-containing protein [Pasteurella sp. PK-2025]|uniref:DUF4176 domain-containing protein n=1 Tax=unclassified Pasteurella TaxID=2621516 RepID=UPI003C75812B